MTLEQVFFFCIFRTFSKHLSCRAPLSIDTSQLLKENSLKFIIFYYLFVSLEIAVNYNVCFMKLLLKTSNKKSKKKKKETLNRESFANVLIINMSVIA